MSARACTRCMYQQFRCLSWRVQGTVLVVPDGLAKGHSIMDAGKKQWVGTHEWMGRPRVRVATAVDACAVVDTVLDRMTR